MRRFIVFLVAWLLVSVAHSQVTYTPNVGLQIPPTGSYDWDQPLNYNFNLIDQLFGGKRLPGMRVAYEPVFSNGAPTVTCNSDNEGLLDFDYSTTPFTEYVCRSNLWRLVGGSGGTSYPGGTGIVNVIGGSAWGSVYNAANKIPLAYLPNLGINGVIVATNYSAACGQYIRDEAVGSTTITLPTVSTGCQILIQRGVSAGAVTIAPPSGVSYDGITTQLAQGTSALIWTDGSNFHSSTPILPGAHCTLTPTLTGNIFDCVGSAQNIVINPPSGQYVTVYPGAHALTADPSGQSTMTNQGGTFIAGCNGALCSSPVFGPSLTGNWSGFSLPTGLSAGSVTDIYADVVMSSGLGLGAPVMPGSGHLNCGGVTMMPNTLSSPWGMQEFTVHTSLTGTTLSSATCDIQIGGFISGYSGATVRAASVRFLVYYTGTPLSGSTTLGVIPPLYYDASLNAIGIDLTPSGGTINFADNEVPSGTINGSNTAFTLVHAPNPTGSLLLYYNGILIAGGGSDYTLSGANITFVTAPPTGASLRAWYRY